MKKIKEYLILIFPLLSIGLIFRSIYIYNKEKQVFSWNETNGIIIHSEVIKDYSFDPPDYYSIVKYEYIIQNKKFYSEKIAINNPTGSPEEIVEKYPKGKKVKVYVNPKNSNESVLEKCVKTTDFIISLSLGIFLLVGGTIISIGTLYKEKK